MEDFTLPPETHIGRVHLLVHDLDRSLSFYQEGMGFQVIRKATHEASLAADPEGPEAILLTSQPDVIPKPIRTTGLYHVAIRFPSASSLGKTYQRLLDHRQPIQGSADHGVSLALYLSDPDGNGLEMYTDRPREEWPYKNGMVSMISDPLDLDSLLAEARRESSTEIGIDPGTDIGHVHLQVSNLERSEEFYSGVLGLEVTQRTYPGALFLSAGGYHHHVGLNIWNSRGAPAAPPNAAGLQSFLLDLPDPDWRQELIARIRNGDLRIEPSSSPDGNERVTVYDPDGIRVEI